MSPPPFDDSTTTTIITTTTATTNIKSTTKSKIRHLIDPSLISYDEDNIDNITSRQRRHDKNPSDRNKQATDYYNDDDNDCEPDDDGVFGNSQNINVRLDVTFRYEIETDTNSNPRKFGKKVLPRLESAIGRSVYEYGSRSCRRHRRRVRRRMKEEEMLVVGREGGGGVRRRLAAVGVDPRPRDVILKDEKCHTPLSHPFDRCFVIQGGMSLFLPPTTSLTNHNHDDLERAFVQLIAQSMNQGFYNDGSIDREIRRVSFIPKEEWFDGISSLVGSANRNGGTGSSGGGGMIDSPLSSSAATVAVNDEGPPSETFILRMTLVGATGVLLFLLPCAMLLMNMKKKLIDEKKTIWPWYNNNDSSTKTMISNTTTIEEKLPVLLLDKPITTTMNDEEREGVYASHCKSSANTLSPMDDASSTAAADDHHDAQPLSWKDVDTLDNDDNDNKGSTISTTSFLMPIIDGGDGDEVTIKFQNRSHGSLTSSKTNEDATMKCTSLSNSSNSNKNTTAFHTINEWNPNDEMMKNKTAVTKTTATTPDATITPSNNITINDTKYNNNNNENGCYGDDGETSSDAWNWKDVEYIVRIPSPKSHASSDESGSQTHSSAYGSSQYDFFKRQHQHQQQTQGQQQQVDNNITSTTPSNYFKQAWDYIIDNGSSKSLAPSSDSGYGSSQYDFLKRFTHHHQVCSSLSFQTTSNNIRDVHTSATMTVVTDEIDDDKTPPQRGDGQHQQHQQQGMMASDMSKKNNDNE